jgi:hypothetical protein
LKRPEPVLPEAAAEHGASAAPVEGAEETAEVVAEDDMVLEQEPDDADVSGLVDHDVEEPKER